MHLRQVKATPNRKCYTWNICENVQLPVFKCRDHALSDYLFEMMSTNVESKYSVLLKESVICSHQSCKEEMSLQVGEITLCSYCSSSLLGICLHNDHQLLCRFLRNS